MFPHAIGAILVPLRMRRTIYGEYILNVISFKVTAVYVFLLGYETYVSQINQLSVKPHDVVSQKKISFILNAVKNISKERGFRSYTLKLHLRISPAIIQS